MSISHESGRKLAKSRAIHEMPLTLESFELLACVTHMAFCKLHHSQVNRKMLSLHSSNQYSTLNLLHLISQTYRKIIKKIYNQIWQGINANKTELKITTLQLSVNEMKTIYLFLGGRGKCAIHIKSLVFERVFMCNSYMWEGLLTHVRVTWKSNRNSLF